MMQSNAQKERMMIEQQLMIYKQALYASLRQDLHNFATEGTTSPRHSTSTLKKFEAKLKEYAEISKNHTKIWQENRGINHKENPADCTR